MEQVELHNDKQNLDPSPDSLDNVHMTCWSSHWWWGVVLIVSVSVVIVRCEIKIHIHSIEYIKRQGYDWVFAFVQIIHKSVATVALTLITQIQASSSLVCTPPVHELVYTGPGSHEDEEPVDKNNNNDEIKEKENKEERILRSVEKKKRNKRKTTIQTRTGLLLHMSPDSSSSILDRLIPGRVSRTSNCLRYLRPTRLSDNYGLGNMGEIEQDRPDYPRKGVPSWAQWDMMDKMLQGQEEVDTDLIFSMCESPNLDLMFPQTAARRDIWRTPPCSLSSRVR